MILTAKEALYLDAVRAMGDPVCEADVIDWCYPQIKPRGVRVVGNSLIRKGRLRFGDHCDEAGYSVHEVAPTFGRQQDGADHG